MSEQEKISALADKIKASGQLSLSSDSSGVLTTASKDAPPVLDSSTPATQGQQDKKSDLKLLVPLGSYHFNGEGQHMSGFHESNRGIGISKPLSEDVTGFINGFKNSYRDNTILAGINYTPLHLGNDTVDVRLGATAAVAYTQNGSYATDSPRTSYGKLTGVAGLYASADHVPSGIGVEATVIPPLKTPGGTSGVVGVNLRYRF
jgi:hypothetical protein